jgi:uncharacterized phage-associated protein
MKEMERSKLLELIVFFSKNTKHCGLVKLFKLLYYADMLHFKETGRSITGGVYKALPYGPVPTDLYDEIKQPAADMASVVNFGQRVSDTDTPKPTPIKIVTNPGVAHLTRREYRIAQQLVEMFRDATAEQISEASHARNGPWDKAKKAGQGKWGIIIDYFDAVNLKLGTGQSLDAETLRLKAAEHEELRAHFS